MDNNRNIKYHTPIKLTAGHATPAPPVGTILGPSGIDTNKFCEDFNKWSQGMEGPVECGVIVYNDLTYKILTKDEYISFRANELNQGLTGFVRRWEDDLIERHRK